METVFRCTACPNCKGEGHTMEYPAITYNMPEKVKTQCSTCHGFGEILFLPPKLRVIVDKEVETDARIKYK